MWHVASLASQTGTREGLGTRLCGMYLMLVELTWVAVIPLWFSVVSSSVCYPSLASQSTLIVSVYNWSSIYKVTTPLAVPVAMLGIMNLGIKFLWLAGDEWLRKGHKLPCEFNDFPKMVFVTALQGFFHFFAGFMTWDFTVHLNRREKGCIYIATPYLYYHCFYHGNTCNAILKLKLVQMLDLPLPWCWQNIKLSFHLF